MYRPKKKKPAAPPRKTLLSRRGVAFSLSLFSSLISLSALAEPSTSYFLSQDGFLTSTKSQGSLGTCWAFSNTTSFESSLLRQGIITDISSPLLDISEWHLATSNGNITVLKPTWNNTSQSWEYDGWGGFNEFAVGYWTRGKGNWALDPKYGTTSAGGGPVLEGTNPLNRYPSNEVAKHKDLTPYVPPTSQDQAPYHIKQSITFDWSGDLGSLANFQESLKQGILDYGAISVYMYVGDNFRITTDQEGYIYTGAATANHAVSLVGWDDSKQFTIDGVTYTGGWLLQNSWGTDWGTFDPASHEGGYFWIPFADTSVANVKEGTAVVTRSNLYADNVREYSPIVTQNQIFAPFGIDLQEGEYYLYLSGFDAGTTTLAAEKLTAPRGPRESTLASIGLWQPYAGMTVEISIYDGWGENGPVGNLLAQKTATLNPDGVGGYNEIDLDTPVTLSLGQAFYVVVNYGDAYDHPVTVDVRTPHELAGHFDFSNLSWISSDGTNWLDLFTDMDTPGIMFMKGMMIFFHLGNDGYVDGLMQTRGTFEVPELYFASGSELYLNGMLTLNDGRIAFETGSSDLKNDIVYTPGDLQIEGDGTLNIESTVFAEGSAEILRGHVNIGSLFFSGGNFTTASSVLLEGTQYDTLSGYINAQNVSVLDGGSITIEPFGGIVLSNNGLQPIVTNDPGSLINYGRISGNGTLVAEVTNSGILSPGHSPGKITVIGSYTQTVDGVYIWEAEGKRYDQLAVQGNATLDGTLFIAGGLQYGRKYSDIVSADAIYGTFTTLDIPDKFRIRTFQKSNSFSFLAAPESYTLVAPNENQRNVAKALDRFIPETHGDRAKVSMALDHLSFGEFNDAFNAIMPGFYETTDSIGVSLNTGLGQLLTQRLDAVRNGSTGLSIQGFGALPTYSKGDGKAETSKTFYVPSAENRWGIWLQGNGIFGKSNSIADIPNYRFNSGGALIGADYRWNDCLATGLFGGYQGAAANYADNGKVRMNGSNFGLYASYDSGIGFYGSAIAMSSFSEFEARRPIKFSSINRRANADFSTWAGSVLVEGGYDLQYQGLRYGPLMNVQYTHIKNDGFEETNANSLNLRLNRHNTESLQSNLGARVSNTWALSECVTISPEVRVFWNHEYLQDSTTYHAAFRSGGSFDYRTTAPSRDSVTTGAGVFCRLGERWSANTYYNANFGNSKTVTHSVAASAEFSF